MGPNKSVRNELPCILHTNYASKLGLEKSGWGGGGAWSQDSQTSDNTSVTTRKARITLIVGT